MQQLDCLNQLSEIDYGEKIENIQKISNYNANIGANWIKLKTLPF